MKATRATNMVMVVCHPDVEEEYNELYNSVHIPMILR